MSKIVPVIFLIESTKHSKHSKKDYVHKTLKKLKKDYVHKKTQKGTKGLLQVLLIRDVGRC